MADMSSDVSTDSQPISSSPRTDQHPADEGQTPALRLPTSRGCPFDPSVEYKRLQDEDPVSRLAFPDGSDGWLLSRYEDVRSLLADPRTSSKFGFGLNPVRELPPEAQEELMRVRPGLFIRMDAPEHPRYRRLLTGQFTVRRMNALVPRIEQIVADHLDAMAEMPQPVDLVAAFALPVPSLVICELLGVPYADRAPFQRRTRALISLTTDGPTLVRVRQEMEQYMLDLVRAKRLQPADDLLSGLIAREGDPEGALTDEELVSIGNLLLIAGHETTANMLALGTLALLEHPGQLEALRADPSMIDRAVEELLRYLTIVQFGLMRIATEEFQIGGRCILAGQIFAALGDRRRAAEIEAEQGRHLVRRRQQPVQHLGPRPDMVGPDQHRRCPTAFRHRDLDALVPPALGAGPVDRGEAREGFRAARRHAPSAAPCWPGPTSRAR